MKTILAVTSVDDDYTFTPLAEAIAARGGRLLRWDTDRFPSECTLYAELSAEGYRGELVNHLGERARLEEVHAVWWRRVRTGIRLPTEGIDPKVRRAARLETEITMEGLLAALDCAQVDDPFAVYAAERKTWQLRQAVAVGLTVPATWVGNAPDAARAFAGRHERLITKAMHLLLLPGEHGFTTMPTSAVGPEDLESLDEGLKWSTAALQARKEKTLEVRAVVIGDRVLTAGVDSQQLEVSKVDWRQGDRDLMPLFKPVSLPEDIERKLVALNRRMGLRYGGADLLRTPEGEWVFLEINPGGEWGWIQEFAGLDVAGALADMLLG